MTIPEYDKECDCDFCAEERDKRLKASLEKLARRNEVAEERRVCKL